LAKNPSRRGTDRNGHISADTPRRETADRSSSDPPFGVHACQLAHRSPPAPDGRSGRDRELAERPPRIDAEIFARVDDQATAAPFCGVLPAVGGGGDAPALARQEDIVERH
jgi:hypothetical protein